MSNRQTENAVVIHERALDALGLKTALIMLEVAKDLRNGIIESHLYDQFTYGVSKSTDSLSDCNTPCCIWGHVCSRLDIFKWMDRRNLSMGLKSRDRALGFLFEPRHATPLQGATAIENYVLKGYNYPWDQTGYD